MASIWILILSLSTVVSTKPLPNQALVRKPIARTGRLNQALNKLSSAEAALADLDHFEHISRETPRQDQNQYAVATETTKVAFIVRSFETNYNTKLKAIMQTWGSSMNKDSLLLVGNVDGTVDGMPVLGAKNCGSDHSAGLACRDGFGLTEAAKKMPDADWFVILDDDIYLLPSNINSVLSQHDAESSTALGTLGCGPSYCDDKKGGICGGGGYAISKTALRAMLSKKGDLAHEIQHAAEDMTLTGGWDDIATTCVMKRDGVRLEMFPGLYPWTPDANKEDPQEFYASKIASTQPLPLTFHYIQPDRMYELHRQVLQHNAANQLGTGGEEMLVGDAVGITVPNAKHYWQSLELYVKDENHRRGIV